MPDAAPPQDTRPAAVADAKRLLRIARTGALASLEPGSGAPLTTLIGVASDFDGAPVFLMSRLARHTRNIAANPRASLLLTSAPERGDPLNHPRLTLGGAVERCDEPGARRRYLQRNPKAKLYAGFADFAVYRLRVETVHFNGGFGRADALLPADILIARAGEAALGAAEEALIAEIDALGPARLAALAGVGKPGRRVWRAVGLDAEGLDIGAGNAAERVWLASPAVDAASWRRRFAERVAGSGA